MASELATTGTVSLSSSLRAMCDDPIEWSYHDDHGAESRRVAWAPPETVTQAAKAEAAAAARRLGEQLAAAPKDTVRRWLASLGTLCAGSMPAADAKAKLSAYASLLDYPAACFTRETLDAAGRAFKWFPSYAEVSEFLDERAAPVRRLHERLRRIAEAPVAVGHDGRPAPKYHEADAETRRKADEAFAACRRILGGGPAAPRPERPKPAYLRNGPAPLWDESGAFDPVGVGDAADRTFGLGE